MNQTIQSKIKDKIQEDISPTRNLSGIHLKNSFWYSYSLDTYFNFGMLLHFLFGLILGMFKGLPARAIHLGFALTLTFLIFPARGKKISVFDIIISIVAAFCCLYIYFFYDDLSK